MKYSLILFAILLSINVSARTITISVVNGFTAGTFGNVLVLLKDADGQIISESRTNQFGAVNIKMPKTKVAHIVAVAPNADFESTQLANDPRNKRKELTLVLYPSKSFEQKLFSQPIDLDSTDTAPRLDSTETTENLSYINAQFPGGSEAMKKFIQMNVQYPEISRELGDQGRIYIRFVVEKNGKITHIKALNNLTQELKAEGIRLVQSMPDWEPGMIDDKSVRAKCTLPITFSLY